MYILASLAFQFNSLCLKYPAYFFLARCVYKTQLNLLLLGLPEASDMVFDDCAMFIQFSWH